MVRDGLSEQGIYELRPEFPMGRMFPSMGEVGIKALGWERAWCLRDKRRPVLLENRGQGGE